MKYLFFILLRDSMELEYASYVISDKSMSEKSSMVRSRVNLNNILINFLEFSVGKIKARTAPHHMNIRDHSELAIAKVLAPF